MLEARDAVHVLFDRAVLKLVFVTLLGWWMIETGDVPTTVVASPGILHALSEGIGTLATLTGYVLYYGGVLSLLVKIVYEAVALADSS
ncbi:hypothetical protein CV102_04815 [Natronococcus pandeyae]|uniref:Uncharacterized protein n=1 Tax=Natronococcus pandeyae TaxID=2055836 RepID=A0A8J8Q971_9EURY|nr:hypothetical protein [Natronococcus pandeyae]TYL39615.1 hypothetical protein CV102_04815 [Natronococcus pandeyae]